MAKRLRINDEIFDESGSDTEEEEEDRIEESNDETDGGRSKYIRYLKDISWFHKDLSRNTAEALLFQNGEEGSYLLRNSSRTEGHFSVSVKCQDSVKHYALKYDPYTKSYLFGNGEFHSLLELIDHFNCQPVLISESGLQIVLKYPYVRNIEEPPSYEHILQHSEGGSSGTSNKSNSTNEQPDFQIGSKEGYMIKRGALHKNWKKRWFILKKNYLKYYKTKDSRNPIRVIDLRMAASACESRTDNKPNCFSLVLPKRTFHFHTTGPVEAEKWLHILQWKVDYYSKEKTNTI